MRFQTKARGFFHSAGRLRSARPAAWPPLPLAARLGYEKPRTRPPPPATPNATRKRFPVTQTLKALGQLALLWAIYQGSTWFVAATGLPIPGNVVGVLLLFALLCLGVIKLKHVELAADFLLKHLVFFFVPVAVGLMEWGQVFYDYGLTLLAAIVISAVLPLLAVGGLTQFLNKRQGA